MPELPDITVYIEALESRILGETLERVRIASPFVLRTVEPPVTALQGKRACKLRRIGKRIAIGFEDDLWLVMHLMIAGRLHWRDPGVKLAIKRDLAAFDFSSGTLVLTEAGTQKRAAMYLFDREDELCLVDPGGLEVMTASLDEFADALTTRNHTLKRALSDPHLFSGIGNAYSDEIPHAAQLSPVALTQKLSPEQIERLYRATRQTLMEWIERLRAEAGDAFPKHVTAFRKEMAAHGRYKLPCPVCGAPIQRIRFAENETNYCARCQTGGKVLADRSLSRLLKDDWPRRIEELE